MKNIRKVIYALIVLNLVVDAAFLVLAPDQVAVHFGASGEADRIGSKYEHLWFPALALAFGLGLPFIAKRSDAHDGDKLLKADVVLLALMAVFSLSYSRTGSPAAARRSQHSTSTWEEAPPSSRASPSSSAATSCRNPIETKPSAFARPGA